MGRMFWDRAFLAKTCGVLRTCAQTKEEHGVIEFQKTLMQMMNAKGQFNLCDMEVIMGFYAFFAQYT
jgi:hypothetical protein